MIVRKGTSWSPSLRSVSSSDSPKELTVSDFGILRQEVPLPAEIWSLTTMLQEKSEMEDKAQGEPSNSSANTQEKGVEFSENPKRPDG